MNTGNPPQAQYPGYIQSDTTQFPPQYPQQNYPPQQYPGGAPQYPQAYHPQAPQQQQQQSTNVIMVGAGPPIQHVYETRPYISFTGAILLSCFSIWCCGNLLIGGIAFIVAMVGQSSASDGDGTGARQMLRVSYGLSIAAIVISVIIIVVLASVFGSRSSYYYSRCCVNDVCYSC